MEVVSMTRGRWHLIKNGLVTLCIFIGSQVAFASSLPVSTQNTDSLEGWNGNLSECASHNLPECWSKVPNSPSKEPSAWRPLVILGGGLVVTSYVGESKSFPIQNTQTDEFYLYNSYRPKQSGGFFDIFLGTEWMARRNWGLQLGVDADQILANYNSNGTFTQGADTQSADEYSYNYSATIRQVLLEGRLLGTIQKLFHPYLLLGLGAAFNTAYNFSTNVPPSLTFTRQYNNNAAVSFSYAAGLGLDMDIHEGIRLGLGYRFTDLGKLQLGQASIDATPVSGTLSQDHLYTNIFLAQISFLF